MTSRRPAHAPDATQSLAPSPDQTTSSRRGESSARIAGVPTATPAGDLPPARDPLTAEPVLVSDALAHSLDLMERFLAHRGGGGRGRESDTVRTERTSISKHCFWLATGRLPDKGPRRQLLLHADTTQPGWVPLTPEDADRITIIDYRDHLETVDTAQATQYREILQLGHFYRWLTGSAEHPVALAAETVKDRTPPRDTSSRHDEFYTTDASRRLLEASLRRVTDARAHRHTQLADNPETTATSPAETTQWLSAEVDHVIACLLWGTGAAAAAICALHRDNIDLDARTITWRRNDSELVQPIPSALVAALTRYLSEVWPHLRIRDDRLLLNPHAQRRHAKAYRPREVQKLTRRLAQDAGLDHLPGRHNPTRWAKTYAQRILEAPTGSLITLLYLQGRTSWVGLERTYGATIPDASDVSIDVVYPPGAAIAVRLPEVRPAA